MQEVAAPSISSPHTTQRSQKEDHNSMILPGFALLPNSATQSTKGPNPNLLSLLAMLFKLMLPLRLLSYRADWQLQGNMLPACVLLLGYVMGW